MPFDIAVCIIRRAHSDKRPGLIEASENPRMADSLVEPESAESKLLHLLHCVRTRTKDCQSKGFQWRTEGCGPLLWLVEPRET